MKEPRTLDFGEPVIGLSASPDGGVLAAGLADGTVHLISRRGPKPPASIRAHSGAVLAIAYHPPSRAFLTTGEDGRVVETSLNDDSREILRLGPRWIENLVVGSASGHWAATTGRELHMFAPDHAPCGRRTLPSAPGALGLDYARNRVAVPFYGGVCLVPFDVVDDSHDQSVLWQGSHLAASVSPDGLWLVSGMQENALHVWPLEGGEDLGMRGYAGKPRSLSWTADSKLLLSSGADTLLAWQFDGAGPSGRSPLMLGWADGGLVVEIRAHPMAPAAAAGFNNGAVVFSDLSERHAVTLKEPDGHQITALGWSPDGTVLMVGSEAGEVIFFDIAP